MCQTPRLHSSCGSALVPRPRLDLIRFHGVLAPNAKLRGKIIPSPAERGTEASTDDAHAQGAPAALRRTQVLPLFVLYRDI
jgi:hypothetical protein